MNTRETKQNDQTDVCDQFHEGSAVRAICDGTSNLPIGKLNAYRERMGLPPVSGADNRPVPKRGRRRGSVKTKSRKPSSGGGCGGGCGDGGSRSKGGGGSRSKVRAPPPNGWGPGSVLLQSFEKAGMPHCQECIDLAGWMDRWGKKGCVHRLDQIVADILPRAQKWMSENQPFLHRLFSVVNLEDTALKLAIRKKVQKAIKKTPARKTPRHTIGPWKPRGNWLAAFRPVGDTPEYLTTERLASDTLSLVPRLPPDITDIAAVSRSGLAPGTLLSMALHLPMIVIRHHQGDWVAAGNGWRLNEGTPQGKKKILVVDDTTMTGNSLRRTKHVIAKMDGEKIFAAVYVNPAAIAKPDIWAMDLPWPHLLEWNLFNSVLLDSFALDFDGILCHDCRREDDDDGPRYERFIEEAIPLYLVRKRPAKLIVTARLEKYRPATLAWMDRWGVKAKELIMGPWASLADREGSDVAAWKAECLQNFLAKRGGIMPKFYIESDPRWAERIAELTGRLVVCPPAQQCFGKAKR